MKRVKAKKLLVDIFHNVYENEKKYEDFYKNYEKIGVNIEKSIFNFTIRKCKKEKIPCNWDSKKFSNIYTEEVRRLKANLTYLIERTDLFTRMYEKEFKPTDLVNMKPIDMLSIESRQEVEKSNFFQMEKSMVGHQTVEPVTTGIFTCRRCKSKKTTYRQMQTRSADEPMTTIVQCLNCSNRWKFC